MEISTNKIIIWAIIAYLLLTFGLAMFDSRDIVVDFIIGVVGFIAFIVNAFGYGEELHVLKRYHIKKWTFFKNSILNGIVGGILAMGIVWVLFMPFIKLWRWLFLFVQNHWGIILMVLGVLIVIVITVFYFVSRKKTN